jgi:hypothetical protein
MRPSMLHAAAAILVALAGAACGDGPTPPDAPITLPDVPAGGPSAFAVLVSNPVTSRPAPSGSVGRVGGLKADLGAMDVTAYVALEPGTVPGGTTATITNGRTGASAGATPVEGGFDPVAIPAAVGDTLTISVAQTAGPVLMAKSIVPATQPPRVVRTSPAKGRTDVAINATIAVIFSEPVDPGTVDAASFRVTKNGVAIGGTLRPISGSSVGIEFVPAGPLTPGAAYELTVNDRIADGTGDRLAEVVTVGFTISPDATDPNPPPDTEPTGEITFTVQPTQAVSGLAMQPAPEVTVHDASGAVDVAFNGKVTLALGNSPVGSILGGSPSVGAVAGVATFSSVQLPDPGDGGGSATLVATAGSRTATSVPFTVQRNPWVLKAPPPPNSRLDGAVIAVNGMMYAIGGRVYTWDNDPLVGVAAVDVYNPATDVWTERAPIPTPRADLAVGVINGIIYAVGGTTNWNDRLATVEAYDPATDSWTTRAPMLKPRSLLGVATVNGKLYAIGGDGSTPGGTVEVFDPATNSWSPRAAMPTRMERPEVSAIDGVIYAAAGYYFQPDPYPESANFEVYDPSSDIWTAGPPAPTSPYPQLSGSTVVNGLLYFNGRYENYRTPLNVYDPATRRWSLGPTMPGAGKLAAVDGVIYLVELGSMYAYRP